MTSRPAAWSLRRSWRPATGRSASGRRWTRRRRPPGTSAAPSTRASTYSTSCPSPSSRRRSRRRGRPARGLECAGPGDGGGGDCDVRREVWGQVREGRHLPHQRPGRAADLLRLPGRALGPPTDVQPDRERVRHGQASDRPHQRCAVAGHRPADGVQAGDGGGQDLASAERREPVAQSRPGRHIPQRRQGHRHASTECRLITASPRLQHSSPRVRDGAAEAVDAQKHGR